MTDQDDDEPRLSFALISWMLLALALAWIGISLTGCSLPDEVGVGTSASQFDMLGGDSSAPYFETTDGNEFGVHAWASWKLRPQRVELVQSERPWDPGLSRREEPAPPSVVVNTTPTVAPESSALDKSLEAGATIDSWDASTKWLIGVLAVVLLVGLFLTRSHVPILRHILPRKAK